MPGAQRARGASAREAGWRAFRLEETFDFGLVGALASVAAPLAESGVGGVGILAISTYDTDYVLVKEKQLGLAMAALREQGHSVR